ncbi:ATP synthase E chain-domain-containing protein [Pyronema omphalodes]|nr:ATP synthase E chain-domain-containing protein [Pyronema omphalodes]
MVLSTQTVNVLRYSALGAGVVYGFYHQQQLNSASKVHQAQAEWKHKEALIAQAKAEWAKKHPVKQAGPGEVVSDPDSPDFDLEKFLNHVAGEKA